MGNSDFLLFKLSSQYKRQLSIFMALLLIVMNVLTSLAIPSTASAASNPKLVITHDGGDIEVGERTKLKVELQDADPDFYGDVYFYLTTSEWGSFFKKPADVYATNLFQIPAGETSIELYYQPNKYSPSTHEVSVNDAFWTSTPDSPYVPDGPVTIDYSTTNTAIDVIPAKQLRNYLYLSTDNYQIVAGEYVKGTVEVVNTDQFGNLTPQDKDIVVDLASVDHIEGQSTGAFYTKDPDGKYVAITSVTIKSGETSAEFYFSDTKAGDVNLVPSTNNFTGAIQYSWVEVVPADSAKIIVEELNPGHKTTQELVHLKAEIHDKFDNVVNNQPVDLNVILESSLDGDFYSTPDLYQENKISHLIFNSRSNNPYYQSSKEFYYQPLKKGAHEITLSTVDIETGKTSVEVAGAPALTVQPEHKVIEMNLNNKVTIDLGEAAPFDVKLNLESDQVGAFYKNQANNATAISNITIPEGQQTVDVYYRGQVVGDHTLTVSSSQLGGITAQTGIIEVTTAAQVQNEIELTVNPITAGESGKVTVAVKDQYGNPVEQGVGGLEIKVSAEQSDGEAVLGKLYGVNEEGNVDNSQEISTITIPEGKSQASFYYYDEKSTTNVEDYSVWIKVEAANLLPVKAKQNVKPAMAHELVLNPTGETAKTVHDSFELEVSLNDKFGNTADPQTQPLTVVLESNSETGMFFSDSRLSQPITHLTFEYSGLETIYYVDNKPNEKVEITVSDKNLVSDNTELKVLPVPAKINLNSDVTDWKVFQRGKVTIELLNEDGTAYLVPTELSQGMKVQLMANPEGEFYTAQVGGDELENNSIVIPAGKSSVDVYFNPNTAGNVQLSAGLSFTGNDYTSVSGKADIIWVVDKSGSMGDNQQNVANNIEAFTDRLQQSNVSPNLGIMHYEANDYEPVFFSNGGLFTNDPLEFKNNIRVPEVGGTENTMTAVQHALDYYPSTTSKPYIVILTDERGDDNHLLQDTLNKANNSNANISIIWSYYDQSKELKDLVAATDGIELDIDGDWGKTIEILANEIISETTSASIQDVLDIEVDSAGSVHAVFEQPLEFTAGEVGEAVIKAVDQYGNSVKKGSFSVDLSTSSGTGTFYKDAEATEVISSISIAEGEDSVTVYYKDTTASNSITLTTDSRVVDGSSAEAVVHPQESKKLEIKVYDLESYPVVEGLYLPNVDSTDEIERITTDKLQPNLLYPVEVSIADDLDNEVSQSSPLTVNLSSAYTGEKEIYGKFYSDPEGTNPITQAKITDSSTTVYFKADGLGQINISAEIKELATDTNSLEVIGAEKLAIHFENGAVAQPEERKKMYVIATDELGRPAMVTEDVIVELTGGNFYLEQDSYTMVEEALTIPAGSNGFGVFVEASREEGILVIDATSETLTDASAELEIKKAAFYTKDLVRGWNVVSSPVKLERSNLQDIIENAEKAIELAYIYNNTSNQWEQVYRNAEGKWVSDNSGEFSLEPMGAIYLKLKGATTAKFYPMTSVTGPYTQTLKPGWNLFGPALDISNYSQDSMGVQKVLATIEGKYNQVVSPRIGYQAPWAYLANTIMNPKMNVGEGYWIYMKEEALLAGFSYTPVFSGLSHLTDSTFPVADELYPMSVDNNTAPPAIPAAFSGTVKDLEGNNVTGTIEAVVDGEVRATMTIDENGQFGTEAYLIVQEVANENYQQIEFRVDGDTADKKVKWSTSSGYLTNLDLTVEKDHKVLEPVKDVPLTKAWRVRLSTAVDPTTVNEQNVRMEDGSRNPVGITISFENDNKTIVLTPKESYSPSTNYYLFVEGDIRSESGSKLSMPAVLKFVTKK